MKDFAASRRGWRRYQSLRQTKVVGIVWLFFRQAQFVGNGGILSRDNAQVIGDGGIFLCWDNRNILETDESISRVVERRTTDELISREDGRGDTNVATSAKHIQREIRKVLPSPRQCN